MRIFAAFGIDPPGGFAPRTPQSFSARMKQGGPRT
jgi:hypothetical protein